ncbi:MAG: transcriptional regulator [Acidobacteria bacterium]|nr:transcriptional regulator [Acidobacteriota bacterium]
MIRNTGLQVLKPIASFALLVVLLPVSLRAADWVTLGPEGGDVRSLAYDPSNPDRIFLGTSAGQLYLSINGGGSWQRFAKLGSGDRYVLDHIVLDPANPGTLYVSAWDVERDGGDLFRSRDGGRNWEALPAMRGRSIRALVMAETDSRVLIVGALDGVFRSADGGNTWQRISPANHAEIRNIESVAVDPRDPRMVYAGTWHLPWKTADGGLTWSQMKRGVIDDSDVFSIIVDHEVPSTVYISACSGIYKSLDGGEQFRKIQGIPSTARRTRVLKQDPQNPAVVYAGTTEGLWKSVDAGATWKRITASNYIINDILIDPRAPQRVLLATDRSGVWMSRDGGASFIQANRGFTHRQVATALVDRGSPTTLYAGVINDKEFGGVFFSRDGGESWNQISSGLGGRDVFSLRQTDTGGLLAGTNSGIFLWEGAGAWKPLNTLLPDPPRAAKGKAARRRAPLPQPSKLAMRVNHVEPSSTGWFAATKRGILISQNRGKSWSRAAELGTRDFVTVRARGGMLAAATHKEIFVSQDRGLHWTAVSLPRYLTHIYGLTLDAHSTIWLATREGGFNSLDQGRTWTHVLGGLPGLDVTSMHYDEARERMLATAGVAHGIFESRNRGREWRRLAKPEWTLRSLSFGHGRLLVVTAFDGVITESSISRRAEKLTSLGGADE